MKIQKTWLTVHFTEGDANIELTINYQTKKFVMTHGSNDSNVTFNGGEEDLLFKVTQDKLQKEPIKEDTVITMSYYRAITGDCREGMKNFIEKTFTGKQKEKVLDKGIKAKDLFPILKKSNAYGFDKFKSLVTF